MTPRATAFPQAIVTRAAVMALATLAAGCAQTSVMDADIGRIASQERQRVETSPVTTSAAGSSREFDPRDTRGAVRYAQSLKAAGDKGSALLVLQQASMHVADDRELASEYGRLALELDQLPVAERMLQIAEDPMRPDWRVLSARGTLFARQARYAEAVSYFERALAASPSNPTVLNNLAMAHAAKGDASRAELLLAEAGRMRPADARIRANTMLVAELQGKTSDQPVPAAAPLALTPVAPSAPTPIPPAARPGAPVASGWTTGAVSVPQPEPKPFAAAASPRAAASTFTAAPPASAPQAPAAPIRGWDATSAAAPVPPPSRAPAVAGWSMSVAPAPQPVAPVASPAPVAGSGPADRPWSNEAPGAADVPPSDTELPSQYWRPVRL